MLTNPTFTKLTVAAFIAYNVASVGFAYRAGQESVNRAHLKKLNDSILIALEQEKKAMALYETLAQEYSKSQQRHQITLEKINQEINNYVQSTTDTCRIDERGVQLINELINAANADVYPADN